MSGPQPPG